MPKKIPDEQWFLIRKDVESGDYTMKALAEKHGLSVSAITEHRVKRGWTNPKTGEAYGKKANQAEPVPEFEQSADLTKEASLNKEQVDIALEEMKAEMLEPEPEIEESLIETLQRELAEATAELADLKPAEVEWPVDFDTAANMLASELDDRVQMELNAINDDRLKRGLPHWTTADMDRDRPGWSKTIKDQIIQDTVDDLTRWATNMGPSIHKIDMLRPDGITKEQIPVGPNIDSGQRPQRLLAKGWRQLVPQSCKRWNCYGQLPEGNPYDGFHSLLHRALFDWQYPEPDKGVTTTGVFSGD